LAKAIAEVCFGVVFPLQPLFHVPYMLDYGKEFLLDLDLEKDANAMVHLLADFAMLKTSKPCK
jgi:hypothetical protein